MRWVQAERLHACRRELAERGTRTIGDVAFDWGFNHPSHFSRAYRRLFGVAPSVA
ncbi:MAG: helix-turn-helix domain-containing protein [Rubrivivax sp.]